MGSMANEDRPQDQKLAICFDKWRKREKVNTEETNSILGYKLKWSVELHGQ